jgi:hypothetical protein
MSADRELLELAAEAAVIPVHWDPVHSCFWIKIGHGLEVKPWDPLADDGSDEDDAVMLIAKARDAVNKATGEK